MQTLTILVMETRFAMRRILRSPGSAAVVIVTLILGIGVIAALSRLTNDLLIRPRTVREPERVVALWTRSPTGGDFGFAGFSYPDYADLRDAATSFASVVGQTPAGTAYLTTTHEGPSDRQSFERVKFGLVTAGYFAALNTAPMRGRGFLPAEETGGRHVAVISDDLWRSRLQTDQAVIGKELRVNGTVFEIVGVAPRGFHGHLIGFRVDIWLPVGDYLAVFAPESPDLLAERGAPWLYPVARLAPGTTVEAAQAEMSSISAGVLAGNATLETGTTIAVVNQIRGHPAMVGRWSDLVDAATPLAAVLLILTCANVANAFLARSIGRDQEVSLRRALGETRRRIVAGVLLEAALLAGLAGFLAALLSAWPAKALASRALAPHFAESVDLSLDAKVVGFVMVISLLASAVFAIGPAVSLSRSDPAQTVAGSATPKPGRRRLRTGFVVVQMAISTLLVIGAILLIRSVWELESRDSGFDATTTIVAELEGQPIRDDAERYARFEAILDEATSWPHVAAAALAVAPPGGTAFQLPVFDVDRESPEASPTIHAMINLVGAGFFDTTRMELLLGRGFTSREASDATPVALISRTLADRLWPDQNAIGRRLEVSSASFVSSVEGSRVTEIIGVVEDTPVAYYWKYQGSHVYLPFLWYPSATSYQPAALLLRTHGPARSAISDIARAIRVAAPDLPAAPVRTLEAVVSSWVRDERMAAVFMGTLAGLALALAITGVYGAMSTATAERHREFGIRLALGSRDMDLTRLVLGSAAMPGLAGILLGMGCAAMAARVVASRLYQVAPLDPISFTAGAVLVFGACLLASYVPLRSVLKMDVFQSLRNL